jgi:hypothetical protein
MNEVSARRERLSDVGVGGALGAAGLWFYGTRWIDLFPLDEFRSWLFLPLGSFGDLLRHVVLVRDRLQATYASRGVSMFVVDKTAGVCNLDARCMNGAQILTVVGSAILLYALVVRLLHRRTAAAVAGALWLFSVAAADSISWQSTIFDKLAACFTLVGLHVGLTFMRRRATRSTLVAGNLALLGAVMLANNAKESGWVLVPSLVLLAMATVGQRFDWRTVGAKLSLLVVPALYAVWHYIRYQGPLRGDLTWSGHVNRGDAWANVQAYLRILANGHPAFANRFAFDVASFLVIASLALVAVAGAVIVIRRRGHGDRALVPDTTACFGLWAVGSFVVAIAIPLRTQFHDPYYMLVPALFLCITFATGITILEALPGHRWVALGVRGAIVLLLVGTLLANFRTTYHEAYAAIPGQSDNFVRALPQIGSVLPRTTDEPVYFVTADARYNAYHFLGTATWRDVYQYIFPGSAPNPEYERHIVDIKRSTFDATPRAANAYYVVFDDAMRLVEIDHVSG